MGLKIDVYNPAGAKVGSGPITTATTWTSTTRLDRSGAFSFEMPASDSRAALLVAKGQVFCYAFVNGAWQLQGAGIVDQIDVKADSKPTTLTVSGSDLSRQLAYRTCGTLLLSQAGTASPSRMFELHIGDSGGMIDNAGNPTTDPTAAGYTEWQNAIDGNPATSATLGSFDRHHWWYLGYPLVFNAITFTFQTPCAVAGAVWDDLQYYQKTATYEGWTSLAYTDTTVSGGKTWGQNGTISFTPPTDWTPFEQSVSQAVGGTGPYVNLTGFWIRVRGDDFHPPSATISEIVVNSQVPTTNGPSLALAPSGWTLDGAGHATTVQAIQAVSQDETVLAALGKVAALTNEHFRCDLGLTQVYWLQKDTPPSGVRAIRATSSSSGLETNAVACLITTLDVLTDATVLATRIRPYGAGQGTARLTLAQTTRASDGVNPLPAGYTLDPTNNWIINTNAELAYLRADTVQTWSNVGPPTTTLPDVVPAANALYDVALFYLQTHSAPILTYRLTVAGLKQVLLPGQTLRVVWLEIVDGYTVLNVNADLIILEAVIAVSATGIQTTSLLVASAAVWPLTEDEVVAQALARLQYAYAHPATHDPNMLVAPANKALTTGLSGDNIKANGAGGFYVRT